MVRYGLGKVTEIMQYNALIDRNKKQLPNQAWLKHWSVDVR